MTILSFVMMTLFNEINARKVHGERNVFKVNKESVGTELELNKNYNCFIPDVNVYVIYLIT